MAGCIATFRVSDARRSHSPRDDRHRRRRSRDQRRTSARVAENFWDDTIGETPKKKPPPEREQQKIASTAYAEEGSRSMPKMPIALTDVQISTVMALARPLSPHQRIAFLEMVAAKLNGQRELGDGAIYRLCRELQRQLFDPPTLQASARGKYD
jgi:hypothetical protein